MDKRNSEHTRAEDRSRAWSDIAGREDKMLTLDQVLEQVKGRSRNQGKLRRNTASGFARKSCSDGIFQRLGGDKPRATAGYEVYLCPPIKQ